MFTSTLTVLAGILLLILIFYVDFKVVNRIVGGGLKTFRQKLIIIYLPVALWFACVIVIYFYAPLFGSVEAEYLPWLRRFYMLLSGFCGIGFMLYAFVSPGAKSIHWILAATINIMVVFPLTENMGFRFNPTPSMPRGIYVMRPVEERPERGDLVTFCLEPDHPFTALAKERGYLGDGSCPSGLKPLLKTLAGLPGDHIEVADDGIILNGLFIARSARPDRDSHGRDLPPSLLIDGLIPDGLALTLSQEHGGSFDSRHFGLVPLESLQKVAPVLTSNIKNIENKEASDGQN